MYRIILSAIILLIGISLAGQGAWLASLGGSWFYVIMGVGLIISAGLLWDRRPTGLSVYALTLLLTLGWALWESGFDWWALSARGSLLVALGVLLLLPPMVRAMHPPGLPQAVYGPNSATLAFALLISGLVAAGSIWLEPRDQDGTFSAQQMAGLAVNESTVDEGEWVAYGRTAAGQRYSPLTDINPQNVADLEVAWTYQTGEIRSGADPEETTYQVTPLVVQDMMYICTPFGTVIALDPVTGQERWRFDPQLQQPPTPTTQHMTCRGVSYFDGTDLVAVAEEQTEVAPAPPATEGGEPAADADTATDETAQEPVVADEVAPAEERPALSNDERLALSVESVTRQAAGVAQNVVTGEAEAGAENPTVTREEDGYVNQDAACLRRIFAPTSDGRLISLSAETGEICAGFGGEDGTINLWANMPNVTPGSTYTTSPPVVTSSVIIVGGAVNDNDSTTSPSGVIRGYDIWTGELVWNFDSKNPDATQPIAEGETYMENSPNMWSIASYDPDLDLVYLPMGNESPDQYGADRGEETERFSSSVTALNASTGEVAWVFQTVHHDLWDYDVPAQPALIDLTIDGETVPALVQPTKQGDIFVLNRETGEAVHAVAEEPAPQGALGDDWTAPTQPHSSVSFRPEALRESDMWGATPIDQAACRIAYRQMRYEGAFTPPSEEGTIVYPGNFGVFNWGSVAVDPERQLLFGMPVYLAFTTTMVPREDEETRVVTDEGGPVFNENFGAPYAAKMGPFLSPIGLPCQQPAWGYIAAVDLTSGETIYKRVNGTVRDLSPVPLPLKMGVPGIGGPIVTKGGVAFLSGTLDYFVRAYDLQTGVEIWQDRLPAGGQATPSTYRGADGNQYLVVVAGGHGSTGTRAGDYIIAYRLGAGSTAQ
ncbi:PQQ-binding-like beta-propeller repeat protein [Aliihoeflea aestuarii]|uniref:outer membrane protein assembly factor BamB family protein n=1 Tax=Aliihoeflea aestuarii TaxID=453840 RepID=UPI00209316B0|nr:PQQ-binding-like beta-propeller repeat protein [Aliihoeflea aestuarii]MCO6389470.1 PQQ-binding-like beta-propeller repeat protein [Aliihoeflea aestuarii]